MGLCPFAFLGTAQCRAVTGQIYVLWPEWHRTVLVQNKEPIFGTHLTFTRPLKQGNVQLTLSFCYMSQLFSERLHEPTFCLEDNCSKQLLDVPCHSEETVFSLSEFMGVIQQPRAESDSAADKWQRQLSQKALYSKKISREVRAHRSPVLLDT